jgi:hypothetical protein
MLWRAKQRALSHQGKPSLAESRMVVSQEPRADRASVGVGHRVPMIRQHIKASHALTPPRGLRPRRGGRSRQSG